MRRRIISRILLKVPVNIAIRGWLFVIGVIMLTMIGYGHTAAQGPTATAVPIVFPSITATSPNVPTASPSPNGPTDLPQSLGRIQAKSKDTGANVRAAPNTDSEKIDTIYPGKYYEVIGRWNKWLLIKYPKSSTGLAWVYEDIVDITGLPAAQISTVDPNNIPTANVITAVAQQTQSILTLTPGGALTVTAQQGSATGVFSPAPGNVGPAVTQSPGPTYTFPAGFAEATLPPHQSTGGTTQSGVPPIVPILALGGVGLFGLLVSALRRL